MRPGGALRGANLAMHAAICPPGRSAYAQPKPATPERIILNPSQNESWGFLHPECHGYNAILFFSWDLAKTIEQQFKLHAESSLAVQLTEAQKAVDRLLNQYVQIQANPKAFEGQSITLKLERDSSDAEGTPVLALQTSPELEELILEMQSQLQATQTIN
jgi:hypothetical protein